MVSDQTYMSRCVQLAGLGIGRVAPNPMVGAVLVHGDRVIGEGYHRACGGPHAEVECLDSVRSGDRHLIPASRMYVSLEPCAHHGKTPPCTDRIIQEGIRDVSIACRDPFPLVDGRGVERLRAAGLNVKEGLLEKEARILNRRFFTFHLSQRPYVVLKWAESADGMIAGPGKARSAISGAAANRLVHLWRAEERAILVGSNTAVIDDPRLTSRIPGGRDPLRIVIDRRLSIPSSSHILSDGGETLVYNTLKESLEGPVGFCKVPDTDAILSHVMHSLHSKNVQSILVEGGKKILQSFLDSGLWDECRRIKSRDFLLPGGYPAPEGPKGNLFQTIDLGSDRIEFFLNSSDSGF